jgi:ubiquinone/menaquinone biosynthesis C-methylase UbiE
MSRYAEMAKYYDRIYSFKDYGGEVARLLDFIRQHKRSTGSRLLDVACGTGRHIEHLAKSFEVEGLDVSCELLDVARQRNPATAFHEGDMRSFRLNSTYDIVTCLFSSIGYMTSIDDLQCAVGTMAQHLVPGGVLLVEPWFTPETWLPGTVHATLIDDPDLKIARVSTSLTKDGVSVFDLHHLIGTPEGTTHFVEHHEMGLYTREEMTEVLTRAGLETSYDPEGLTQRGLHIGVRPHA